MANQGLGLTVDVEGLKEFNKIFNEYLQFQKKAPSEVVNHKLLNIAIRAKNNTKKADATRLKNDILAPSRNNPEKSVGEMIVLSRLPIVTGKQIGRAHV